MSTKLCSKCGHQNLEVHTYCTQCGNKLFKTDERTARLVMLIGDREQATFPLVENSVTLGRDKKNKIILNDNQVSKTHAEVFCDSGQYWIQDLNSKNGIYINGKKIQGKGRLLPGFLIKMGATILRFELPEQGK